MTAEAPGGSLPDLAVAAVATPAGTVRLSALAEIASAQEPMPSQIHVEGRSAWTVTVTAAPQASPFQFDRDLRRNLALLPPGVKAEILRDDVGELRRMLLGLGLGALCAALILGAAGWKTGGPDAALDRFLALPVALAAALLVCRLGGVVLDRSTLTAIAGAVAAALPSGLLGTLPGRRSGSVLVTCALAAAGLPVALRLGGSPAAQLLERPAWVFCLALLASLGALRALGARGSHDAPGALGPLGIPGRLSPPGTASTAGSPGALDAFGAVGGLGVPGACGTGLLPPRPRPDRRLTWPRFLPRALRQPDAVVLGGATAILLALGLWGGELIRAMPADPGDAPDLSIEIPLPQGASLGEAERQVSIVEQALGALAGVRRFWSRFDARHARIEVQAEASWQGRGRLQLLVERLRLSLPAAADAALRIGAGAEPGHVLPAAPDLLDLPDADEAGNSYRCILRSTRLGPLQQGYSRLVATALAHQIKRERLHPDWGPPTLEEDLAPRRGVLPWEARRIAAALRSTTLPALRLPFPGRPREALIVLAAGVDLDPWRAPQRASLLDRQLLAGDGPALASAVLETRRWMDPGRILRQSGRFVLPVRIDFLSDREGARKRQREALDQALAAAALPPGVELQRPSLTAFARYRAALAEAAPAGVLLLLWLGLAAVRLGSPGAALAALAPLAAGLAAAAAGLWAAASLSPAQLGPLGFLLLAAGLAAGFPLAVHFAATAADAARGIAATPERAETLEIGPAGAERRLGSRAAAARWYAWREPWALWGGLAATSLLALPAVASLGSRIPWALPLGVAAAAAGAAVTAAVYLVPSLIGAAAGWRDRASRTHQDLARPAAWQSPGSPSLAVRNLTKTYRGGVAALAAVTFEMQPGVIGLLGPNGAGKTTLLRLLVGILEPSRGSVFFRGLRVTAQNGESYRRQLGFLPQELNAYPGFTARHYLEHWAAARGFRPGAARDREISELLARVGLREHENRKARDFSGGMLRRLGIAAALLGSPPLLIVDEPTAGLDFAARADFRQLLLDAVGPSGAGGEATVSGPSALSAGLADAAQAAVSGGSAESAGSAEVPEPARATRTSGSGENRRIVVLSTHIASDVEAIASKLLVLDRGRLRYDGTVAGLIAAARGRVFAALVADVEIAAVSARYRLTSRIQSLDGVRIRGIAAPDQDPPGQAVEPTLEEAYLALLTPTAKQPA